LEADRLQNVLRGFEERVALHPAVLAIEAGLPVMAQRISDAKLETKTQLDAASSLTVLINQADLWLGIKSDLRARAEQLRIRAEDVGMVLDELAALADKWTRTREELIRSKAPAALLKRADDALAAIAAVRALASARRAALLTLQVKIGDQLVTAEEASAQVARAMSADMSTLLERDRPPVWGAWREGPALADLPTRVRESAAPQLGVLERFAAERSRWATAHLLVLVVLIAFAAVARRQIRGWEAAGNTDPLLRVFDLPISMALIITLLLTTWLYERAPMIALNVVGLVILVPVVRILRRLTKPAPTGAIWIAAVFFTLNRIRDIALLNTPVIEQYVVLLLTAGAAIALVWLWRRQALVVGSYRVPEPLAWIGIVMLVVSFVLGAFGYMRLARLIGGGIVRHAYTALELYTGALVALGLFACLLRVWPLARLHMVERHRLLFERRAQVLLSWVVALFWLAAVLRWFSLLDPAENLLLASLDYRITRGFVSLSLGDVLALVATIWLAFLVSRFVRFALEEDVYPRLSLGRGLPYAISSLLHYLILLLGFLAAIGAMGVDLNRVTLLTGAFGVGVGFGLQTVVNNFVSGIILLLERPIQVGDAIQMPDLDGEVRRIGIRATTVHTWRGAEVIVPNATLISGNVTNWTLSDRTRRFELQVGVAYGSDPQRAIELLREAAASVPGVLSQPGPVVLFQSFGDSALNFEVRAWTARFEEWAVVHSQVAVAVNAALRGAGIEIPFPQRDVNLRFPSREET
jgi:small-conductance mechanosensitive channel